MLGAPQLACCQQIRVADSIERSLPGLLLVGRVINAVEYL